MVEIILVFSPAVFVIVVASLMQLENPLQLMAAVWVANVMMLILIGLGIRIRGDSWSSIGAAFGKLNPAKIGWAVLKSIGILAFAIAGMIFGSIVGANIVGIPEGANMTNYNFLQSNLPMLLISLVGVYIVSSFGEEVVYRGFLITRIEEMFGRRSRLAVTIAIVISSIIFGFAHYQWGPMGIFQTTFMGAALGISFLLVKRNLWPLVLAHGAMDTILLVQLYLAADPIT